MRLPLIVPPVVSKVVACAEEARERGKAAISCPPATWMKPEGVRQEQKANAEPHMAEVPV